MMCEKTNKVSTPIAPCDEHAPFIGRTSTFTEIEAAKEKGRQQPAADLAALPTHNFPFEKALRYVGRCTNSYNCLGTILSLRPRMSITRDRRGGW
jgi:hypothetical protein